MNGFEQAVAGVTGGGLFGEDISSIQANVGLRCNQRCRHCHVSASPERTEMMAWPVMEMVLRAAGLARPSLVDITGGAPELNPELPRFIGALRREGHAVQVRTNLTVLLEPGMEAFPELFSRERVALLASLPFYEEGELCARRGEGVFPRSLEALRRLNERGYGSRCDLPLSLVHNHDGPMPPDRQDELEDAYRRELGRHGIAFNKLLVITNVPAGRFVGELERLRQAGSYHALLLQSFNPRTLDLLFCRHQVTVGWDGTLYDCDFNLGAGLPVDHGVSSRIEDFEVRRLAGRRIVTGPHCFACTAGAGSS